jgi:lactoylglutathione lyase
MIRVVARDNTTYPYLIHGNETASDPATTGFFNNHLALNVRNVTASIDFYSRVFGFRHLFTYYLTQHYGFAYMAHASGGKNGSGYQTTEEMIREKNNRQGLLEFQFYDVPEATSNLTASTKKTNTFSHIGVIVPDLTVALARFQEMGVNILSKPGDIPPIGGELMHALGLGSLKANDPDAQIIQGAFQALSSGLIFITDPDGNLIEVLPLDDPTGF